ncbi:cis-prenyltransferase, putative [Ixodes scapularis]|uniref:Alkyl transferase n=1 Tax=Ixodes scapularis TaxID=6945 RepID=B7Q8Z3_IXOSC|nr:cis-prenyltransferase, putative [Ixodes scapularis]|eukprot:XP_002405496.1 cis-prenyltransferase, putative [Ixodes scapularis]
MSWIHETRLTWLQAAAVRVLKTGKIPTHLAVIMDGNRRFAKKQNMQCVEGHLHGFEKLSEVLFWCSELGITEVTVYAFSIENFKRSKEEVDGLMDLALKKLESLLNEMEKIHEKGLCVRVLGNLSYLPVEVQKVIADVVLQTQHNTRCYLNICISYTSREEMCNEYKNWLPVFKRVFCLPMTSQKSPSAMHCTAGTAKTLPWSLELREKFA